MNISIESEASDSTSDYNYLDWKTKTITLDKTSYCRLSADGWLVSGGSKSCYYELDDFYSYFDLNKNTNYVFDVSGFSCDVTGTLVSCTNTTGSASNVVFGDFELIFDDENNMQPVLPTVLGGKYTFTCDISSVSYVDGYFTNQKYDITFGFQLSGDITIKYAVMATPSSGSNNSSSSTDVSRSDRVVSVGDRYITSTRTWIDGNSTSGVHSEGTIDLGYKFEIGRSYRLEFDLLYEITEFNNTSNAQLADLILVNNMECSVAGNDFSCANGCFGTHYSIDFVANTSSSTLKAEYDDTIWVIWVEEDGGFDYPKFYANSVSHMNFNNIVIRDVSARTTNEILEDMEAQDKVTQDIMQDTNETSKGIFSSITEFFGSFFQNLIDSVIGIFVPSSEEMSGLFDRLNQFFEDTFGFLYYPFEFIIEAFNLFLTADSSTGLTFPAFSIMGYEVWGAQTYDLASDPTVQTIFGYVRMATGALLAMAFVNYLRNFFDKRFGGGGN